MNYEKNLDTNNKTTQMKPENLSTSTLLELATMNLEIQELIVKYCKVDYGIPDTLITELQNFSLQVQEILLERRFNIIYKNENR